MAKDKRVGDKRRKWKPITDAEVLELLKAGKYRVDIETGDVYGQCGTSPLATIAGKPEQTADNGHQFVRLCTNGDQRRTIAVHRLCWMQATGELIPPGYEVHHRDDDRMNNAFLNLIALHSLDHKKMHGAWTPSETGELLPDEFESDEVPF